MRNIQLKKSTPEWSQTSINFLNVRVSIIGGKVTTDLYIKPTGHHQYLQPASCNPHHFKKEIVHRHVLRGNRIFPDPKSFNRRCNDLEKWLIEKGYSEREVPKQNLRVKGFPRDSLLDREITREEKHKIHFNLTYYPVFIMLKMSFP